MKTNFNNVMFMSECPADLHEPDSWSSGLILNVPYHGVWFYRQQGGGEVIFGQEITGDVLIRLFKVKLRVKINSESCCKLFDKYLMPWLEASPWLYGEHDISA